MGNANSSTTLIGHSAGYDGKPLESSLTLMALSRKVFLRRSHILSLRNSMANFSDFQGRINREGFERALAFANLSSVEIFNLLFTMWNDKGGGNVSSRDFCAGISPLACPFDDLPSTIDFALRVSDDANIGIIERHQLEATLVGINLTASFLGDPNLLDTDINAIVDSVFDRGGGGKSRRECVRILSVNPYVRRFASGKPSKHVTFKEILRTEYQFERYGLVTDYVIVLDDIDALVASTKTRKGNESEAEIGPSSSFTQSVRHILSREKSPNEMLLRESESSESDIFSHPASKSIDSQLSEVRRSDPLVANHNFRSSREKKQHLKGRRVKFNAHTNTNDRQPFSEGHRNWKGYHNIPDPPSWDTAERLNSSKTKPRDPPCR